MGQGALWSIVDNLTQQVLSFVFFLLLARLITPQDFGVIAVVHVLVTFFRQTVLDAIVLPVSREHDVTDTLYSWALVMCVLSATAMATSMVGVTPLISDWLDKPELREILPWMAVVVLAYGASAAFEARLIRKMAFRSLAIRSVIAVTTGGVVGVTYASHNGGVMALVAQQVTTSCVAMVLLMIQSHWMPTFTWSRNYWEKFSPDMYRISATGFTGFLSSQGDTVLVSVFLGAQATGIYSFAKRLTSSVYLAVGAAVLRLSVPAFAAADSNARELETAYIRILGTSMFLILPMLLGLSVLIEPIIQVFFGDAWMNAAPVVALLSAMYLLLVVNQINDHLLYAMHVRSAPLKRSLGQIILSVILGTAGAQLGLAWMAAGFALAALAVWPWNQHICNVRLQLRISAIVYRLLAPLVGSIFMAGILWVLLPSIHDHLIVQGSFGMLMLGAWIAFGGVMYVAVHRLAIRFFAGIHDALRDFIVK